jgi:hypothetical protein
VIAIGRSGPGQQNPGAQLGQPATPPSSGNEDALIFKHCAVNLKQQLVMRIFAHRPIQKLDSTAMLLKFFQPYHLMPIDKAWIMLAFSPRVEHARMNEDRCD